MKKIKNIKDYIETEHEEGYVIHITWDELWAIEQAVATDADEREEAYETIEEFCASPWDKARIKLLREIENALKEVRC